MDGTRIGDYVVERELGSGGMGSVYLGRSRSGRAVAIKVIRAEYATDPQFRDRFRKEVEAARRVGGFHTAAVVDADPDAAQPWMASAYIKGPTLASQVDLHGPLAEARLWVLVAALAEALQAIHSCGLVHRDLKPGNIVLAEDGPRVLDFGIARAAEGTRLTCDGAAIGTPGFISPEQARGLPVTGACDVFALGAVLVAAAGGSAFGGGQPYSLLYRAVHEEADVSAVPDALRPITRACLRKEPELRPSPRQLLGLCDARNGSAPAPTAVDHTAPTARAPRRPTPASPAPAAPPPALYRHDPRLWRHLVLRNGLLTLGLLAACILIGPVLKLSVPIAAVCGFAAAYMLLRFLGLLGTAQDGHMVHDLGIGVGRPKDVAVLRWPDIGSLELDVRARKTLLIVRPGKGRSLPRSFDHPMWVRIDGKRVIRIRASRLAPVGTAPALSDMVRVCAARHGIPLTEARPR